MTLDYDKQPIKFCFYWFFIILLGMLMLVIFVWGILAVNSVYSVWSEGKVGEAELSKSNYAKQIQIVDAEAKLESAKSLADAEVVRAKGVAEANIIIGGSISDDYLKYLYVQGLQTNQMQTIYVPTNGFLPVFDINKEVK